MLRSLTFRAALFAFSLLLWTPGAPGQSSKKSAATIQGVVLDANGKAVPAAAVTCQSSAGIRARIVHTDKKGHFVFTGLKQDDYDLRASSNGAYSDWERNLPIRGTQTKEVTLRLMNGNTALSGVLPTKNKKE